MAHLSAWLSRALSVWLCVTALAKIAALPDVETFLPLPAYCAVTVLELSLAALLMTARTRLLALHACLFLSAAGIALSLLVHAPCGCLGAMVIEKHYLYLASAAQGVVASLAAIGLRAARAWT